MLKSKLPPTAIEAHPSTTSVRRPSAISQALRAVERSTLEPATQQPRAAEPQAATPGQDCWPCSGGWRIARASDRTSRERAWRFAYEIFNEMGYQTDNGAGFRVLLQDALPEVRTYTLEPAGNAPQPLATLSMIPDSPLRLPLDAECLAEASALRAAGRRLCEVARLANAGLPDAPETTRRALVLELFRLAYLDALRQGATDLVISVVPRHARFYRHVLLFETLGEPRAYRAVGGTVGVPLRLNLETAAARYRAKYSKSTGSLYNYFFVDHTGSSQLEWLRRPQPAMPLSDLHYFFAEQTGLLQQTGTTELDWFLSRFPDLMRHWMAVPA